MVCDEFSLITRYFDHVKSPRPDVELGIGDDYTLLSIPEKRTLAISTDTLVAGNYFLPDIGPADLTYKTLAANLSDLAAMEVDSAWLTLALTLPDIDEARLEPSSDGLFGLLNYYDMQLISDSITRGLLSMTLGIRDFVPMGRTLTRSGARPGDWIYVIGTPDDGVAGLATLQSHLQVANAKDADHLIKRYLHPSPHILQGQALRDLANSAINLSDDLISDLGHIVRASGCGAYIDSALLPFSNTFSRHAGPEQALRWAFSGGEDYELCFMVPELNRDVLDVVLGHPGVPFTYIGQMTADTEGLCFIRDGEPVTFDWKGYDYFAAP